MHKAMSTLVTDEIDRRIGQKFPAFTAMTPEVQERFAKYWNPDHNVHLAALCFYDTGALDLVLKFYPELESVDWSKASKKWCEENWLRVIPKFIVRTMWYPELLFDFGMPYREVAKLPRKEFALKVLGIEDVLLRVHFDLEKMEVWAGYKKPPTETHGNVVYLKR